MKINQMRLQAPANKENKMTVRVLVVNAPSG